MPFTRWSTVTLVPVTLLASTPSMKATQWSTDGSDGADQVKMTWASPAMTERSVTALDTVWRVQEAISVGPFMVTLAALVVPV